jgi:N-acyl homoserine lactone hydrolase
MAILDYGLFQVHEDKRVIGICGYVIQTDAGENVLIDSGFPAEYAADPVAATRDDNLGDFGEVLSLGPENLAPAQLARLGLSPQDLDLMIQSHTHIDHMGYMGAFDGVPILIAQAERALPHPLYWSQAARRDWPDADYRTVEGDQHIGPGFEVLLVPGHAPGQLAFALRLPQTGVVLLTSDAISRAAEVDTGFAGAWNADLADHHARRLIRRAAQDRALLIYGHSPSQWPELRKAPDWYL